MSADAPLIVPVDRLQWSGADAARLEPGDEALSPDAAMALLVQVVRSAAGAAADGAEVHPVSVTLDITGSLDAAAALDFSASIDRRTRTIVFLNGSATQGETTVVTATAVFRILA